MAQAERLICASADLVEAGDGVRFDVERQGRIINAFVVRFQGRVYAYLNQCAHVPVELDWQAGRFFDVEGVHLICSTHGALYAPDSGRCLGGPCRGGALEPLQVEERDGKVLLRETGTQEHG